MPIINQIVKGSGGGAPSTVLGLTVEQSFGTVSNGVFNRPSGNYKPDFTGVTAIGLYALYGQLMARSDVSGGIDAHNVQTVGAYAFQYFGYNSSLSGAVDFSNVTSLDYYSFANSFSNSRITSIDFGNLEEAVATEYGEGYGPVALFYGAFQDISSCTSINFSKLRKLRAGNFCYYSFGNSHCTEIRFDSLDTIDTTSPGGYPLVGAFSRGWSSSATLTDIYFPALRYLLGTEKNHFTSFEPGSAVTVHFPSNMQATIEAGGWTQSGFVKAYDLPAVVTLTCANSEDYVRNPKYDTQSALAWRVADDSHFVDWTAYYTSGTTDPAVGDTIYSDAACTTALTTISTIA